MTRRGKIVLAVLVVGSVLGLVAATNAWFIAVSNTPPGAINSALVHWLPEAGERSFTSLLTYGNVISGSGVDPDGVPLVLPGNSLLSSAAVSGGKRTVRTSIARAFEEKETVDTVIHWEVRELNGVEITRKQRDLMKTEEPLARWYEGSSSTPLPAPPTINPTQYDIVTTTSGGVGIPGTGPDGRPTTTTTITVITTYTPRITGISAYRHEVTTTQIVTEEEETFTPKEQVADWAAAAPVLTATETVLFVQASPTTEKPNPPQQPTRSYLIIEHTGTGGTTIPLALGNLSTVNSNLRIGLNARLTSADGNTATPLTLAGPDADGTYYLGASTEDKFVELISFRPYASKDRPLRSYQWTPVQEKKEPGDKALWSLWDLTVNGSADVPALPTPSTPPSAVPSVSPSPVPAPEPEQYIVTDALRIVSKRSAVSGAVSDAEFEQLFNVLYCDKIPTITLHLSYYTRQSEFMSWNEFYSQDIDMNLYL